MGGKTGTSVAESRESGEGGDENEICDKRLGVVGENENGRELHTAWIYRNANVPQPGSCWISLGSN